MSEILRIYAESLKGFGMGGEERAVVDEIGEQVKRPADEFCDIYKELTFIYIRYTGTTEYYKDINPFRPADQEPSLILNLLNRLCSKLAEYVSGLYSDSIQKSDLALKSLLQLNTLFNSSLVQTVQFSNTTCKNSPSNHFFTSLIEFAEFITEVKQVIKLRIFNEDDLDFIVCVCVQFGFCNCRAGLDKDKILKTLGEIFRKYSDDIKVEGKSLSLNGTWVYKLFKACSSISCMFLKQVKETIFRVYTDKIADFDTDLNEILNKVKRQQVYTKDCETFITNLATIHNLFIIIQFSYWHSIEPSISESIIKTHNAYQQANFYFHSLVNKNS